MSIISLDTFKKHIRADDICADDDKLQLRLDAAETYVTRATNRTIEELVEMGDGALPTPIVQAVLMVAASFDENTQAVSTQQLHENPMFPALLKQYRKLSRSVE